MLLIVFAAGGCGPGQVRPGAEGRLCPGMSSATEAIAVLEQNMGLIPGVRSVGRMVYREYDGDKVINEESLNLTLRCTGRDFLFLRADSLVGEVIRAGMNAQEFWLRMTMGDDVTYWYGTRAVAQPCRMRMLLNPASVVEALGIVEFGPGWTMSHLEGLDILDRPGEALSRKKVYVNCCEGYVIERIEYFDTFGRLILAFDLTEYERIDTGAMVPGRIHLTSFRQGWLEHEVEFELRALRGFVPSADQAQKLYERPASEGADAVYELRDNCEFKAVE